jgi:hypothetical protein
LKRPEVELSNNVSEPGLRGAATARKVSQCSKSPTGAQRYEAMKSVTATLAPCGRNVVKGLVALIKGKPLPAPGPPINNVLTNWSRSGWCAPSLAITYNISEKEIRRRSF